MKQRVSTLLVCLLLALGFSAINPNNAGAATNVANGDLYYIGGQTSSVVYSEIGINPGVSMNYCVEAIVKVGGDKYSSHFQNNYAYVEHKKSFWKNETSWYDYRENPSGSSC